jgi:hypothetical protein
MQKLNAFLLMLSAFALGNILGERRNSCLHLSANAVVSVLRYFIQQAEHVIGQLYRKFPNIKFLKWEKVAVQSGFSLMFLIR